MPSYNNLVKGGHMNFSEYCEQNKNFDGEDNLKIKQKSKKNAQNLQKNEQKKENLSKNEFDEKYNKYKNMSEQQLMEELFKEASLQKQSGNLSAKKLADIKNSIAPILSAEQQKRLDQLIDMLR